MPTLVPCYVPTLCLGAGSLLAPLERMSHRTDGAATSAEAPASSITTNSIHRSGIILGISALLLAVVAGQAYMRSRASRVPAENFLREFSIDRRRPTEAETVRIARTSDLAAAVAADAALQDLREDQTASSGPGGKPLREMARVARRAETASARALLLDALRVRPGSATHRLLLGRLILADRSVQVSARTSAVPQWRAVLHAAASAAPGMDAAWTELARAYLADWNDIPAPERQSGEEVFRRSLYDSGFVAEHYADVRARLGPRVDHDLPDHSDLLSAALESLGGRADVKGTLTLLRRLDDARRRERDVRMRTIERLHRIGDLENLSNACETFFQTYTNPLWDDVSLRRQFVRVLEVWPPGRAVGWPDDPRARLVRYLLDSRDAGTLGPGIERTLEHLQGVPDAVWSEVKLLSGDLETAEQLVAKSSAGDLGSASYLIRLAGHHLAQGRPLQASEALARLGPASGEECDAVVLRREVARVLGDVAEVQAQDRRLEILRRPSFAPGWSSQVTVSLCITSADLNQSLSVPFEGEGRSIVAYGWQLGRVGVTELPRAGRLKLALPRTLGLARLSIEVLYGRPLRLGAVRVQPPSVAR
ncbi:MAG TPA: hypothetical protein VNC59_00650 [Thermoanaerobaculia bacterium]|nr:hypothetical protein [Thermoanaerobaculia bacterium]